MKASENQKRARGRREYALARQEIGQPTAVRTAAAGVTSMGVKVRDSTDAALIQAFLSKREKES